ncbi:hypothetical protein [Aphanothece microscopica]|uniref:hypothetical protein n=1 Tax=Aphanothece microscopica TaxID=1049561 RepID=UPI0039850FF4
MATITYSWQSRTASFFMNNTVTAGAQGNPAIASSVNGASYLGAWEDIAGGGSVEGRLVNATGAPVATQFTVNGIVPFAQYGASIAGLANGTFVVSYTDNSTDPNGDIRARLIDTSGNPIGTDITVSANASFDTRSDVAGLTGGGFVVTWMREFGSDFNIYAQRFNVDGTAAGGVIFAAPSIAADSTFPSVAGLANGGFVIAWAQRPAGGGEDSIVARRYDASGVALDSGFLVSADGSINQDVQVLGLADGGFVVAYTDNSWGLGGTEISARIYNADGSDRTTVFRVNEPTAGDQNNPSLTLLSNGFFVVGWSDGGNLMHQAFNPFGNTIGTSFVATGSTIEGEIAALTGGLVANVRSSTLADAGGDNSIRSSINELSRMTDGTAANELLAGDSLRDVIEGLGGADFIAGGGGGDSLNGGAGFDSVSWFGAGAPVLVNLTNQALNAFAAAGDTVSNFEAYYLTNSADSFTNAGAGGYIYGFGGGDIIIGGAGSEFIEGGLGADQINGAGGFDYASYANAAAGVRVDFTNAATNTGEAAGDVISNVEAFYLSAHGDIFIGQTGQNIVFAGNGGDALFGGVNANDWLFGEGGADFLSGGNFDDLLSGGAGADTYAFASWVGNGFDSILDFTSGQDRFQLTGSGFGLLAGTAIVNGVNFIAAASPFATSAQGTLLYATGLGILYYDPDGAGAGAAIALAQITGAPLVTAGDFVVA